MKALWVLPLLGVIAAGAVLGLFYPGADSAPKEAAVASLACAIALLPYVFVRTVEGLASGVKKGDA